LFINKQMVENLLHERWPKYYPGISRYVEHQFKVFFTGVQVFYLSQPQ
jgi:hypothetical protein